MTYEAKLMSGITLITIPSIEYGGFFLLRLLGGAFKNLEMNGFQKSMFRAGHAHAGVIVLLSLICQVLIDDAALSPILMWLARAGVPASALLISGGFFFSAMHKDAVKPNKLIALLYAGIFVLGIALVITGVGLLNNL